MFSLHQLRATRRCSEAGGCESWEASLLSWWLVGNSGSVSLLKLCRLSKVTCSHSVPDEAAAGSLPLVSVSLFTPLTPAEMAPYMKRLSRGQTVEGKCKNIGQMQLHASPVPQLPATRLFPVYFGSLQQIGCGFVLDGLVRNFLGEVCTVPAGCNCSCAAGGSYLAENSTHISNSSSVDTGGERDSTSTVSKVLRCPCGHHTLILVDPGVSLGDFCILVSGCLGSAAVCGTGSFLVACQMLHRLSGFKCKPYG